MCSKCALNPIFAGKLNPCCNLISKPKAFWKRRQRKFCLPMNPNLITP